MSAGADLEIRRIREELGLTQEQFARLLGVHPYTISRWERGPNQPSPYQQELIAQFAKAAPRARDGALAAALQTVGAIGAVTLLLMWAAGQDAQDGRRGPRGQRGR